MILKSKTREEIEFGIEDSEKCAKTFEHIGFKKSELSVKIVNIMLIKTLK